MKLFSACFIFAAAFLLTYEGLGYSKDMNTGEDSRSNYKPIDPFDVLIKPKRLTHRPTWRPRPRPTPLEANILTTTEADKKANSG
eukprot:scaffold10364_cov61-Attheya_sp.AAC.4